MIFLTSFQSLQAPRKVGHFGPRLCLEHFRQDDIIKTKTGGVRLKTNACPLSKSSVSKEVTNDMLLVSAEGIHIPTNTSLMAGISPVLKIILRYNHDHFEEDTKLLIQDYSTETVEAFLELLHMGDVCLTGRQIEDVRSLISALGIDMDVFTVSPTEVTSEYLTRYSSNGESSTAESLQDQEGSSLSNEVDRSVPNNGISCFHLFFSDQLKKK